MPEDRVEHSVAVTLEPSVVAFLLVPVGFVENDCASHLSKSLAGLQFLGLVAALATTMPSHRSARTVWLLLNASAAEKIGLPAEKKVRKLMLSLGARCQAVGLGSATSAVPFVNVVVC